MRFTDFQLHPQLLRAVADMGFETPTPIQQSAIPPGLEGRDVLGCAMTGSGKTAAFALPVLQRLIGKKPGSTRALVLAPTRELAAQITEHFTALGKHTGLRAAAVYGGVGMEPQEKALRRGVDVIVACPGRLLDHIERGNTRFDGLEVLVLDEADRMLDMGFLPDIHRILAKLPAEKQSLLFSATLPREIRDLAAKLLKRPAEIDVARPSMPATGVRQTVFPVNQELKTDLLVALLKREPIVSALVFTRTKHRANRLADRLLKAGVDCERVHGNRSQAQRTQAMTGFKSGRYRVLVATDVAARGIDVEALSHVINFDVPQAPDDYIHRVGRTARAGASGEAFTFAAPDEQGDLRAIERAIGKTIERKTLAEFDYRARASESLEIPLQERIAAIRTRRADDRERARAKATRRSGAPAPAGRAGHAPRPGQATDSRSRPGAGFGSHRARPQADPRRAESRPASHERGASAPRSDERSAPRHGAAARTTARPARRPFGR